MKKTGKTVNESMLIKQVAKKTGISQEKTKSIVHALLEEIESEVAKGNKVVIMGFGKFEKRVFKPKKGTNPITGKKIKIPKRILPRFTAGKVFKEKVSKKH